MMMMVMVMFFRMANYTGLTQSLLNCFRVIFRLRMFGHVERFSTTDVDVGDDGDDDDDDGDDHGDDEDISKDVSFTGM